MVADIISLGKKDGQILVNDIEWIANMFEVATHR